MYMYSILATMSRVDIGIICSLKSIPNDFSPMGPKLTYKKKCITLGLIELVGQ